MTNVKRYFLFIFTAFAALGLAFSIVSHVSALLGLEGPLGESTWVLHIGIFVVWIPTLVLANVNKAGGNRKEQWEAAIRNCPPFMKYMSYGLFFYALVNFFYFAFFVSKPSGGGQMPPSIVRGFSGHWMAFYSIALSVLYSAVRSPRLPSSCLNGHKVGVSNEFCERCGQRFFDESIEPL